MTPFFAESPPVQALLVTGYTLAVLGLIYDLLFQKIALKHIHADCRLGLLLAVAELFALMTAQEAGTARIGQYPVIRAVTVLPAWAHAVVLTLCVLAGAVEYRRSRRDARSRITSASIRDAADNLPSGICFFGENGFPLLVNHQMYAIYEGLSGRHLQNAGELWDLAQRGGQNQEDESPAQENMPVLIDADQRVWELSQNELELDGAKYYQMTAMDITRQYRLREELQKSNEALARQQQRLSRLLLKIAGIQREEEMLASKVRIHDELGRCVLATRRYLVQQRPPEEAEAIFALWKNVSHLLDANLADAREKDDSQRQLEDAANALGCRVRLYGELPSEHSYLILCAIREAVTNAVRHGLADEVTARIETGGGQVTVFLSDNGKVRVTALTEGGGLKSLRQKIEKTGGTLEIRCDGHVELRITLPLSEEEEPCIRC